LKLNFHIFKTLSVYAFALLFNAAVSFITFSFLTHHLNEVDYGVVNLYNSFTIFLVPFVSVGVQFTLSVDYFKMDDKTFRSHFTNAIALPLFICFILLILFFIFHGILQKILNTNLFFTISLPLSCLLIVLGEVLLNFIRNKGQHFLYAGFSIFKNLTDVGITLLLVITMGLGWQGRLGGAFIALVISGVVIYYLFKKWNLLQGVINKTEIKNIFKTGLPFIPERLAIFFLAYSDRFFIDYYRGTGDVGYYGAGAQIAIIVNLCILSLISTFQPYVFKNLANSEYRNVRKATLAFIGIAAGTTLVVILSAPLLFKLFIGERFQSGQVYAKYLSIGFFLWSIYMAFVAFLLFMKKNRTIMFISVIGMILSVSLNFFNVSRYGAIGATYTSMIVYLFMAAACIYAVHKNIKLGKIFFPS
jgi:O-antigen/teichoic acid export membrane protein